MTTLARDPRYPAIAPPPAIVPGVASMVPLAPSTYALDGARRSDKSELTDKSEHSLSGVILTTSECLMTSERIDTSMSKATSKAQQHAAMVQTLNDAKDQAAACSAVWDEMTDKLARGFAQRNNDPDANVWLYLVVHRNVYKDHTFKKIEDFYQSLADRFDPGASKKSIRNHFDNRRALGAEYLGKVESGNPTKDPKPAVVKVAEYLAGIPAKLASVKATPEQTQALADAVNKAGDAVRELLARMDSEQRMAAIDTELNTEPTLTASEVDALLAASEKAA